MISREEKEFIERLKQQEREKKRNPLQYDPRYGFFIPDLKQIDKDLDDMKRLFGYYGNGTVKKSDRELGL